MYGQSRTRFFFGFDFVCQILKLCVNIISKHILSSALSRKFKAKMWHKWISIANLFRNIETKWNNNTNSNRFCFFVKLNWVVDACVFVIYYCIFCVMFRLFCFDLFWILFFYVCTHNVCFLLRNSSPNRYNIHTILYWPLSLSCVYLCACILTCAEMRLICANLFVILIFVLNTNTHAQSEKKTNKKRFIHKYIQHKHIRPHMNSQI